MSELINIRKLSSKFMSQCNVLCELESNLREFRPESLKGFFFTTNQDTFAIAQDVVSGVLKELKKEWVDAVIIANQDILIITSCERKTIRTLSDIGVSIREILSDIENYDQYAKLNSQK